MLDESSKREIVAIIGAFIVVCAVRMGFGVCYTEDMTDALLRIDLAQ
jgi:hypothetical protein